MHVNQHVATMSLFHLDEYKLVKKIETIKCIDIELYMEELICHIFFKVGNMKNKQIKKWKCKGTCMYTTGLMKVGYLGWDGRLVSGECTYHALFTQ